MKKLHPFALIIIFAALYLSVFCGRQQTNLYLRTAENAALWVNSVAVVEDGKLFWPSQPDTMSRGEITLYHGVPGGVLFYVELYKATGNEEYKRIAEQAGNWLIAKTNEDPNGFFWSGYKIRGNSVPDAGLYTGTAGVCNALLELSKVSKNSAYIEHARKGADWMASTMTPGEKGAAWSSSYDIISGAAGTGLFMIRAAKELGNPEYLEAAKKAGELLINVGIDDPPGIKWGASAFQSSRIYPNFSHGTSGIAYFLAALYTETGDKQFLDAALEGAEWLKTHEEDHGIDGHAWYHHDPDGKELYYVSWCHGPGGTARLFYQLYLATGDEEWMKWVEDAAEWLTSCGLTEKTLDGYWNVSACCGDAGIADFFADLYKVTGKAEYLDWAKTMTEELRTKASPGNPGIRWIQAENRTRPNEVYAQTGLAQGSAGIGLLFLKMYALTGGNREFRPLTLPDSPFVWR